MSKTTTLDQVSSVPLPPEALDALGVTAGAELDIEIVGRALVIRPIDEARRSRDFMTAFESILNKRRTAYENWQKVPIIDSTFRPNFFPKALFDFLSVQLAQTRWNRSGGYVNRDFFLTGSRLRQVIADTFFQKYVFLPRGLRFFNRAELEDTSWVTFRRDGPPASTISEEAFERVFLGLAYGRFVHFLNRAELFYRHKCAPSAF